MGVLGGRCVQEGGTNVGVSFLGREIPTKGLPVASVVILRVNGRALGADSNTVLFLIFWLCGHAGF